MKTLDSGRSVYTDALHRQCWAGALLVEVELSHDCLVVELLVKQRGGSVATQDLGGQSGSLSRRGLLEVVIDLIDVLGARLHFRSACQLQSTGVFFERSSVYLERGRKCWELIFSNLPQKL